MEVTAVPPGALYCGRHAVLLAVALLRPKTPAARFVATTSPRPRLLAL